MSRTTPNSPVRSDGTASNVETADNQRVSIEMADRRWAPPDAATPATPRIRLPLSWSLPTKTTRSAAARMGTCACRAVIAH
jgi:hypothetical protein